MAETSTAQSDAKVPFVPKVWPGAFGAYKHSKAVIQVNLWELVGLLLLSTLIAVLFSGMGRSHSRGGAVMVISDLVTFYVSVAVIVTVLHGLRGKVISVAESLKAAAKYYLKALVLAITTLVIYVVSLTLLVVPFFFVFPRLVLAQYFLIDKNLGPIEAIRSSWNATKDHVGKVYGIIGASIAMILLMFTIIGIPFAIYFLFMYNAAYAVLYGYLTTKKRKTT
jgi:hypothetical protein